MRTCDRCRKELDTDKESSLAGEKFELCLSCAEHISNHIKRYDPKKNSILGGLFKR